MSLLGTLDTLSLSDLFELLAATGKTGALHVRGERGLCIVYFSGGRVCGGEAGERSGPVVDRGSLLARLHDVCFELFRFEAGSFEFEADLGPAGPPAGDVEVGELLAETRQRLEEWRAILAVVPSVEARPRLVSEPPGATVTLDRGQWRVLTGIDGRRRVSALIRVLDGSEFEVCKVLAGLVQAGLVELDAAEREQAGTASGVEEAPEAEAAPSVSVEAEAPAAATADGEILTALEEAARAAAQEEERRRAGEHPLDPDGLNRGAVVAFLSNSRRK